MAKTLYKVTDELRTTCRSIAEARVKAMKTQVEVAKRLGIAQATVSRIESASLGATIDSKVLGTISKMGKMFSVDVPALEQTLRLRTMRIPTRTVRPAVKAPTFNEDVALGVLNLVAQGAVKPDAALTMLKTVALG
jgi:DNA-binding XRE family transcriptional regulator